MKSIKSLFALSAVALAVATPVSQASVGETYQATFQGITFTFTELTATSLSFELAGTFDPLSDWATAAYLASFDVRDLGFQPTGGTASGPGITGTLAGIPQAQAGVAVDCSTFGNPQGAICFDINQDYLLATPSFDITYTLQFTQTLNIADAGPHLRIAFTETQGGNKVGSFYSQNVGTTSSTSSSSSTIPEPNSASLALLALGLLGAGFWTRRKA